MNVREAAEALLDATRECGNMDEITEYCNDLREALAEPEPVTVDQLLRTLMDFARDNYDCSITASERGGLVLFLEEKAVILAAPTADAIMRVLREQASGAREDGE
jgi:hypothetical protein